MCFAKNWMPALTTPFSHMRQQLPKLKHWTSRQTRILADSFSYWKSRTAHLCTDVPHVCALRVQIFDKIPKEHSHTFREKINVSVRDYVKILSLSHMREKRLWCIELNSISKHHSPTCEEKAQNGIGLICIRQLLPHMRGKGSFIPSSRDDFSTTNSWLYEVYM